VRDPYYESVLPIPQIVVLVNQAGELIDRKRKALQPKYIDEILVLLSKVGAALDGHVSDWSL
jgi:hypothetical protein